MTNPKSARDMPSISIPVSYTHLDVYKRQILDYLKENRKATTNELSELLGVSTTTITVSYTHLDVYKRQVIIHPSGHGI